MTSGLDLLMDARTMSDADVVRAFGHRESSNADQLDRAALVAALLSSFTPDDAPLIRELTRQEIAAVGDSGAGCGDVLLACCWLLFTIGHVEDAALVWRAKNINFDAHSYIDSVFLIPQGVAATAEFARSRDLVDLVDWVEGEWLGDTEDAAREWRSGSFFDQVPPAAASVEDLATWMRQ